MKVTILEMRWETDGRKKLNQCFPAEEKTVVHEDSPAVSSHSSPGALSLPLLPTFSSGFCGADRSFTHTFENA